MVLMAPMNAKECIDISLLADGVQDLKALKKDLTQEDVIAFLAAPGLQAVLTNNGNVLRIRLTLARTVQGEAVLTNDVQQLPHDLAEKVREFVENNPKVTELFVQLYFSEAGSAHTDFFKAGSAHVVLGQHGDSSVVRGDAEAHFRAVAGLLFTPEQNEALCAEMRKLRARLRGNDDHQQGAVVQSPNRTRDSGEGGGRFGAAISTRFADHRKTLFFRAFLSDIEEAMGDAQATETPLSAEDLRVILLKALRTMHVP